MKSKLMADISTKQIKIDTSLKLLADPTWAGYSNKVLAKTVAQTIETDLTAFEAATKLLQDRVTSWNNPSRLSKVKNVFKDQAKLDEKRKLAKKFAECCVFWHDKSEKELGVFKRTFVS